MEQRKNDVFGGLGVRITLKHPDDFLKVKETLTRIGVSSKSTNTLYQSCHILHKQGQYAILHFKELFILDGKPSTIDETDIIRRDTIVKLLNEWGLIKFVDTAPAPKTSIGLVKVLPFSEKDNWTLASKYTVGTKK